MCEPSGLGETALEENSPRGAACSTIVAVWYVGQDFFYGRMSVIMACWALQ